MKLVIYSFLSVVTLLAFYSAKDKMMPSQSVQRLNLALAHPIRSFDPAVAFNDDSLTVIGQSLETLYQYHYLKRPYEVIPALAKDMPKISKDGRVYTISIKENVPYHNHLNPFKGKVRYVQAEDFVNQIKRLAFKPLKSTGAWLFSGKIKGFDEFGEVVGEDYSKMLKTPMAGLKALDDHTLQIELTRSEPNMLYFLSMIFTTPVPKELILKYENDLSKVLIGTGAFYLAENSLDKVFFKKNPSFRAESYPSSGDRYANTQELLVSSTEKLPFLDEVEFKVIEDEEKRWESFMKEELDILNVPKKFLARITKDDAEIQRMMNDKGIKLKHFSSISSRWLGFNMQDPVLGKNLSLRKAIAHAIDYERYISLMSNNTNLKANSIFNPSIPGYNPSKQLSYKYDINKAKQFLADSGHRPGELTVTYTTRGTQDIHFVEAEFIKDQLKKIGINVKVEVVEFSEFLKKGRAGELQFFTDNWIYDYPDAENVLQLLIGSNSPGVNKSAYKRKEVDALYASLAKTLDRNKRKTLMNKIETIVDQDIPWIMLMFESSYILHYSKIKNFRRSYFIRNHLKYLKKE